jgi:hypothetical protein
MTTRHTAAEVPVPEPELTPAEITRRAEALNLATEFAKAHFGLPDQLF